MTHVLQHLREVGWWRKPLQPRVQDMEHFQLEDGMSVTDESIVAKSATQYYKALFELDLSSRSRVGGTPV